MRRFVQVHELGVGKLLGQAHRRESRRMQDLVGVGVADAAEEPRIGKRALERVILALQRVAKVVEAGVENLEAARIMARQAGRSWWPTARRPVAAASLVSGFQHPAKT